MSLLSLRDLSFGFGNHLLLDNVSLTIQRGEKVCLIGRNGEGKTTLLKLLLGKILFETGTVLSGKDILVAELPQTIPDDLSGTAFSLVQQGLPDTQQAEHYRVERVLMAAGIDPNADFQTLSGGAKRRVLFARAMVSEPDLLLLDEPTNHLDLSAIEWLEQAVKNFPGAVLFVTHDRSFLKNVASSILELDRGKLVAFDCDYETYLTRKAAMLDAEAMQNHNFDKALAVEEHWVRHGISARRKRNQGRVRKLLVMREARLARRERRGTVNFSIDAGERSGQLVIEAKGMGCQYDNRWLIQDFSTTILRGDKIGIIGPNGIGKTTLLRLLLGDLPTQCGTLRHGTKLTIAYFDQLRQTLDPNVTLRETVGGGSDTVMMGDKPQHVIGYLQEFLFTPEQANRKVGQLSGGEKNRLLLAKLLTQPANVLVLDEPTNDLDIETLELLESKLVDYAGTLLLVSHDRTFLNNIVTSTIVFEGEGRLAEYVGGYDDWLRQRPKVMADKPKISVEKASDPKRVGQTTLTSEERKRLRNLPKIIERLEVEQASLHEQMGQPAFYQQAAETIAETQRKEKALSDEIADMYAEWERLEAKG